MGVAFVAVKKMLEAVPFTNSQVMARVDVDVAGGLASRRMSVSTGYSWSGVWVSLCWLAAMFVRERVMTSRTVRMLVPRIAAISLVVRPCAMRCMTAAWVEPS